MNSMVQLTRKDDGSVLAIAVCKIVVFNALSSGGTILFLDHGQVREVNESYEVICALMGGVKVL